MTTITSTPSVHADRAIAAPAAPPAGDPNELVGSGATHARWLGGLSGAALGIGAGAGIAALTGRSPLAPVRIAGAIASLGVVGGGAFGGQKLLGHLTRSTRAEVSREADARRADVDIEYRMKHAELKGDISGKELERVKELRRERVDLVEARPDANFLGKWLMPIALGVGAAALAGTMAYRLSPDDGKGLTAMFNAMMAIPAGGAAGAWIGGTAGHILTKGPHVAQIPADAQARISQIDRELDGLLGPAD